MSSLGIVVRGYRFDASDKLGKRLTGSASNVVGKGDEGRAFNPLDEALLRSVQEASRGNKDRRNAVRVSENMTHRAFRPSHHARGVNEEGKQV
eukprot:1462988-Rhodomonas_salina.1